MRFYFASANAFFFFKISRMSSEYMMSQNCREAWEKKRLESERQNLKCNEENIAECKLSGNTDTFYACLVEPHETSDIVYGQLNVKNTRMKYV